MPRRPKGHGTIVARKDGRIEIRYAPPGGVTRYRYTRDPDAAEALLAALRAEADAPVAPSGAMTVGEYLRQWLTTVIAPSHPHGTVVNYRVHLERRIIPFLGAIPLHELSPPDIQRLLAALVQQRYAPATIRVCRNVLSAALTVAAEDWRLIPYNPTPRRGLPRVRRREPPALSPERARAILTATDGTDAWGWTALGLLYGLRHSEALGLRRKDIGEGVVRIAGQLDRYGGGHVPPKTGWSERELPIVPLALTVIAAQPARGPWLFSGPDGDPLRHRAASRVYELALRDAGIARPGRLKDQHLHIHGLRHGTVSLLLALGVDERTRQAIVGHAPQGTHGLYSHTSERALRAALERLSAVLSDTESSHTLS